MSASAMMDCHVETRSSMKVLDFDIAACRGQLFNGDNLEVEVQGSTSRDSSITANVTTTRQHQYTSAGTTKDDFDVHVTESTWMKRFQ